MSNKAKLKPLSIALGTAVSVSLVNISVSSATENPFSMEPLSGGYMMLAEGKCGGSKGKSMEGGCGMKRMDADADGNVTHDEFMKGHDAMFKSIDANGDGVIDSSERAAHMEQKKSQMKQGKCGGSK
jgi:hypothetical protein